MSKTIDFSEYFFVIDSDNISDTKTDMFGYAIQTDGVYERANVDKLKPDQLEGCGAYVHIERTDKGIVLRQDAGGSFGLYLYRKDGYFAISNSFFRLVEHLQGKKEMTVNKDYVNHFLVSWLTSLSYGQTALNEVELVHAHASVIISWDGKIEYDLREYNYNTIPINSKEGIELIDKWYNKWLGIVRNIAGNANQVFADLSGGMDSRLVFMFLLNSGVDLNRVFIRSLNENVHTHSEDYEIANDIAAKYNFVLNDVSLIDGNGYNLSQDEVIQLAFYVKMLFHKEMTFPNTIQKVRRYWFGGFGGELIRPYWNMTPERQIDGERMRTENGYSYGVGHELAKSSENILRDTYRSIKEKYTISEEDPRDYSFHAFRECYSRNHFGKIMVEASFSNAVKLSPIIDPLIQKIKLDDPECGDKNLLVSFIFTRYAKELLDIRFDSNRSYAPETLEYAKKINEKWPFSGSETDIVKEFHFEETIHEYGSNDNPVTLRETSNDYIYSIFKSDRFKEFFCNYYSEEIYDYAETFKANNNYFPNRYVYSVVAVGTLLEKIILSNSLRNSYSESWNKSNIYSSSEFDNKVFIPEARIDIRGKGFKIISISDPAAYAKRPDWMNKDDKFGYSITSTSGSIDIAIESNSDDEISIALVGPDVRENDVRKPIWIKYKRFLINGKTEFETENPTWHDKPYKAILNAKEGEPLFFHIEWDT